MTEPPTGELRGNRAVEDAAIVFVIAYELRAGRVARDTRGQGAAADVESGGWVIEVKAAGGSARGAELWLERRQVEEARRNPLFHLYVVDNVRQGDPRQFGLIDLHGEQLEALLQRAMEQHYYTVPFPVGVYGTGRTVPGLEHGPVPPSTVPGREQTVGSDVREMSRTSAIVHVLTSAVDRCGLSTCGRNSSGWAGPVIPKEMSARRCSICGSRAASIDPAVVSIRH